MDFEKIVRAIEADTVSLTDSTIMKEMDRQAADYNRLMTDKEKALLVNCPYCDTSYGHGWSEVDADDNCRVTCGFCENFIEYKIECID